MDLIFDFDRSQGITNVRFDGLDGSENVTSVKEALGMLKIRNPTVTFAEATSNGVYDNTPSTEFTKMLETVKYISKLWQYLGAPKEALLEYEMNPLMILASAIEALSQFYILYQMPSEETT